MPCPTCGTGRAVEALAHADLAAAAVMNPLFFVGVMIALAAFVFSTISVVFKLPEPDVQTGHRSRRIIRTAAICLFLLNWAFLIFVHR